MRKTRYSLALIPALLMAASCSDTCTENKNALPFAGFYRIGSSEQVSVDSLLITGIGAPGDSVLSPESASKSSVYLPFKIDSDTTRYIFTDARRSRMVDDTVTFVYSRTPRFANVECGVSYIFDIRDILFTGTLIDSVSCPSGFIDNTNQENLKIYFSTDDQES